MKPNAYFLSLCIAIALGGAAFGVPANSKVWTFTQPDGTMFQGVLLGDEFYSYHQILEGEIVLQDRDSGEWFYAEPRADGSLQKTSVRVGQDTAATSELNREKSQWVKAIQQAVDRKTSGMQGVERVSAKGTIKGVLLLANFSDTLSTHTPSTFNSLTNTTGYQSNGALGSVKDYYLEASYGQLTLQTDVHGWFPLPETHAYYGEDDPDPTKNAKDLNVRQMIEDAITAADPTVNFADYDSDGDGWVDMFGVVHQGLGQEVTGRDSNYIWSHRGSLSQAMTVDGVRIQHYYTVPELSDGSQLTTIGVFCHEIGHFLGLPDLYDYDRTSVGVGHWSIMASGSWLGPNGNGAKPCHFDAWCKYMLGWISPQIIYDPQSGVPLPGFDTHPTALLIPVDPYQDGEYFLVSNRYARATVSAATGFDEYLPGSGALILHVDDYMPDNDDETRKKIDVEEADGLAFLDMSLAENNYNRGDPGDLYPNGASVFDDSTNPNSRDNDGIGTGIAVYNFTGAGTDTMACDVTPHAQLQGYTVLYDLMGNDRDYSRGYSDGDDYACVRFVSEQGGTLERVKTHFVYEGTTDYTVNVYSEWRDNGPAGLLTTQSGSHTGNSYEEIFLSEPQTFDKGAEFVIEVRYNTWGGYGWPLPVVNDGACSERTYVRSSSTAAYYQYTKANDRPFDALIRAGLRAPSPSGTGLPSITVTPSEGLASAGNQGGPFSPSSKTYTLTNTGGSSLNWQASKSQAWVSLSQASGTLAAGGSIAVTVSINSNAAGLGAGSYSDTVYFTNLTNNNGSTTRPVSLQISAAQKVATPTFSPAGGTYPSALTVTISCATSGATIRYTRDGSTPTETSTLYSAPISITTTTTLKAKAWKSGWTASDVRTAVYTIQSNGIVILEDTWPSERDDATKWTTHGTEVDDRGENEPSPPYSLHFNTGDSIRSKKIDLSGYSRAVLTYYYERGGTCEPPDDGDDFASMYWDGSSYRELRRHLGSGPVMYHYEKVTVALPAAAMHRNFMLRFEARGDSYWYGEYDDWFLDDVELRVWP